MFFHKASIAGGSCERIIGARLSMNYKVVVHESEESFSVSCPGLPGCWSLGATEAEALENIQDAIREYLAVIHDLVRVKTFAKST